MNLMIIMTEHINRKSALSSCSNSKFPNTHLTLYSACYSTASSWITTPHLRPLPDTELSESHPGLLAHVVNLPMAPSHSVKQDAEVACERMGPFAVSAAQISVKIREEGSPSLPSEVVLDKRPTLSAPAIVTLQVKDEPRAPSDVHADVSTITPRQPPSTTTLPVKREPQPTSAFWTAPQSSMSRRSGLPDVSNDSNRFPNDVEPSTQATQTSEPVDIETAHQVGSPFPKHKQAARPQLSSSIFEPQALAFTPTSNSQAAAPVSEASSSPAMGSPQLPPLNQSLIQSADVERGTGPGRPAAPRRSTTMKSSRTSRSISTIAPSEYTDMIFEPISSWNNFWTNIFLWIILAGFLVLPSTFPNLETIVENADQKESGDLHKVLHLVRHVSVYVPSSLLTNIRLFRLFIRV